jgi:hypothetical protein
MIKKPSDETVPLQEVKTRTVGALGNRQSLPCNVEFLQRESGSAENYPSSPAVLLFQNTYPISIPVSKTSRLYAVISLKHSIISYGKNKRLNEGWEGVRPLSSESYIQVDRVPVPTPDTSGMIYVHYSCSVQMCMYVCQKINLLQFHDLFLSVRFVKGVDSKYQE